ncbi:MAG: hypothetical protein AB1589_31030 [Cyanobacteriota bacterium]
MKASSPDSRLPTPDSRLPTPDFQDRFNQVGKVPTPPTDKVVA